MDSLTPPPLAPSRTCSHSGGVGCHPEFLPEDAGLQDSAFLSDARASSTVQALKRDMERLGFGAKRNRGAAHMWRACFANRKYKVCVCVSMSVPVLLRGRRTYQAFVGLF